MKFKTILLNILLSFLLISCQKDDNDFTYTLSGYITYQNMPVENVKVTVDGGYDLNTISNSNGFFIISNISKGAYQLHMSKNFQGDSGGFVEKTMNVFIDRDTELENLRLPKAVNLYDAQDVTQSSAKIIWSSTDDGEFREYKLYKHDTSGLDETTGTLIHISTSLLDTVYNESGLNPLQNYFYRVYVMDDFGRIGGSNIMTLLTDNFNIIKNGGFEEISETQIPLYWDINDNQFGNPENYIKIDDENSFEGNNSLEFYHAEESGCWEMWITQIIDNQSLVENAIYELNFAHKSDFTKVDYFYLKIRSPNFNISYNVPINFDNSGEWTELSYQFGLPENIGNNNFEFILSFCIEGLKKWWIDNINVERIQ